MPEITPEDAVNAVRSALGFDGSMPGRAWRVGAAAPASRPYYLVELGDQAEPVLVGTVDAVSGEVTSHVRRAGRGPHLAIDEVRARELAGTGPSTSAELVWKPCAASKSPLYPLWAVATPAGVVYVDQGGVVRTTLEPGMVGG